MKPRCSIACVQEIKALQDERSMLIAKITGACVLALLVVLRRV